MYAVQSACYDVLSNIRFGAATNGSFCFCVEVVRVCRISPLEAFQVLAGLLCLPVCTDISVLTRKSQAIDVLTREIAVLTYTHG